MIRFICSTVMSTLTFTILVIFGVVTSQNQDVNLHLPYSGLSRQRSVQVTTSFPPDASNENEGIQIPSTHLEDLCAEKLEQLITDTNTRFQSLETKVENLSRNIQEIMNVTRNMVSDVASINVTRSVKQYPRNCREVRESERTASGIYVIQPEHATNPFKAVCDLKTRGGGWTVIQNRFDGSQDFYLGWEDYKQGFGNLEGEFWLGLENIHLLTGFEVNELMIEISDFEDYDGRIFYSQFTVGSEVEGYSLKFLGLHSGDGGDDLTYHSGMKFSTKDKDQDDDQETHCARNHSGGWWYYNCAYTNLNGKYFDRDQIPDYFQQTIYWYYFNPQITHSALKSTKMLVRPKVITID